MPVLAGLVMPRDLLAQPGPSWRPGLQLYTVRDALGTDMEGTLRSVAGVGYREVELAGLPGVTAQAMQRESEAPWTGRTVDACRL